MDKDETIELLQLKIDELNEIKDVENKYASFYTISYAIKAIAKKYQEKRDLILSEKGE